MTPPNYQSTSHILFVDDGKAHPILERGITCLRGKWDISHGGALSCMALTKDANHSKTRILFMTLAINAAMPFF